MKLYVKAEKGKVQNLNEFLEKLAEIRDGFIIKEEIENFSLQKYSGEKIEISESFYSLIGFDKENEVKISRDGTDLYFRRMADAKFDGAQEIEIDTAEERTYYLKGKYDKETRGWWEDQYSPEFSYPGSEEQDIPELSRAGLRVKIYRNEEGEVKYFRLSGYTPVAVEKGGIK